MYYWLHRALHHHALYSAYHSHHHASFVTEPITGSVHPFMEHLMYTANFAIPLLGTWAFGGKGHFHNRPKVFKSLHSADLYLLLPLKRPRQYHLNTACLDSSK